MNLFKNQEFRFIKITKAVENFVEECEEFETLYETNFEKPFDRDQQIVSQRSSKSKDVTQNHPYPSSLETLATVQSLTVHPNHPNFLIIQDHLKNYY